MDTSSNRENSLLLRLMLTDLLAVGGAFVLAYYIRLSGEVMPYAAEATLASYLPLFVLSAPLLPLLFRIARLYDRHEIMSGTGEYVQIIKGCTFYTMAIVIVDFFWRSPAPSRGWLVFVWVLSIVLVSAGRAAFRKCGRRKHSTSYPTERALIVGASEESRSIAAGLQETGLVDVVGFLDDFTATGKAVWHDKIVLGAPKHYRQIADRERVNLVILVPEAIGWETRREVLSRALGRNGPDIQIAPGLSDLHILSMRVGFKGNVPLLRFPPGYIAGFDAFLKQAMDLTLATLLLVVTAPLMLVLGLLLWLQGGRPVVEKFKVLGKGVVPFHTFRFRTPSKTPTCYRSFHKWVSPGGEMKEGSGLERFLFHTALDKLPQLCNVLMGRMSLVGPRTISPDAAEQYGQWLQSILAVKPGLTGNWAIREARDINQEISLSLYYIRNWNLWTDIAILAQTLLEAMRTRFRTRLCSRQAKSSVGTAPSALSPRHESQGGTRHEGFSPGGRDGHSAESLNR